MDMYRFDVGVGKVVDRFESTGASVAPVTELPRGAVVNCVHLAPGGRIGYHQASVPQLFLVVSGEGWVRSETTDRIPIRAGQAAFWQHDEWHESGSDEGMMVVIIEAPRLDPGEFMPPV